MKPGSLVNPQMGLLLPPPPAFSWHWTPTEDRHTEVTLHSLFEPHAGEEMSLSLPTVACQERKAQGKGEDLEPRVVPPACS